LQTLKNKYGGQNNPRATVAPQQRAPPPTHQSVSKVNPNVPETPTAPATKDQSKPRPTANPKPEKSIQNSDKKPSSKGGAGGASVRRKKKDPNDDK
jgi:hypothetical protein